MSESPQWAREMAEIFKGGSVSQFILYGNVDDWVSYRSSAVTINPDKHELGLGTEPDSTASKSQRQFYSLRDFLTNIMFSPFEVVLSYDRGRGIRALKGGEIFNSFLKVFDDFHKTGLSRPPVPDQKGSLAGLDLGNLLPKEPKKALALIDRFIRSGVSRARLLPGNTAPASDPLRIAVILDYSQYLVPRTEVGYASAETVETVIRLLDWASDPTIISSYVATCLVCENLADLNRQIVENPRVAKIPIELPNSEEVRSYIEAITASVADFTTVCDVDRANLAQKLEGLSRVDIQNLVERALHNNRRITMQYLRKVKKEMIEKSAGGRIEFVESSRSLDDVASHTAAKIWLRQDALLMKMGKTKALPMGYLVCGRIGTGKTYLVECFAGEAGVPCVELKNFRDRWVGATEGNLEAIFKILHAMGQVIVFIDEADQIAGKREGGSSDSGLSGRIYGMLAREMADTRNRGRILWIFATSRPDLLEVDLKRVGRLDVHIPLYAPQNDEEKKELFMALARKNKVSLKLSEIPQFPKDMDIGGNEMEGILIMASRLFEVQEASPEKKKGKKRPFSSFLAEAFESYRPMAHAERLEFMDLIATIECTDTGFLPDHFAKMNQSDIKRRVEELRIRIGEMS